MTNQLLEDCKMYNKDFHRCEALDKTYCRYDLECSFYKPEIKDADDKREDKTKA